MSSHLAFPLSDFYDALVSTSLKQKLLPFVAQFKKKNIYIIFQCVNRLIQIITNKSQVPNMKFNALMATRIFFDTCEYAAIIFIEVYLLPIIYQIALQKYLKRSEEGVQMYFIDRGAQNTKQMKRLGLNYVELASQFIFNSAKVKPFRLIQNNELNQQSNFSKVVKILKNKNINQPQKCIYYIPSYQAQTRKKYLKKLKHLTPEPYISFVITQYLQQINLNKKCDLDLKKILLFGDAYITSTMINIIQTQLDDMSHNFVNKKKFVSLLNDMIRSGDIQAIILLNSSEFINQITSNIQKVRGDISPNQGQYIYPKIQASKQEKKQFYLQFLRCLQIWAYSLPTLEDGDQSDAKIAYDNLKNKNFVFPQNVILKKIKVQMQESLKVNQQRNQALMRIIQQDDDKSVRNSGSYLSDKGEFKFKFVKPDSGQQYLQLQQLQNKVFQAKKKIARLGIKEQQLDFNMNQLNDFKQNWDKLLDKLDIQDEDGHQLQILLEQGDLCCEQIKILQSYYIQYKNKKLTQSQFLQKIQLFLNSQDGEQTYSNNSKKKLNKKFQNISRKSQTSISIDNDLKSQKKLKEEISHDISIDSKQSLMSKNKQRLNKAKGSEQKKQIKLNQFKKNMENNIGLRQQQFNFYQKAKNQQKIQKPNKQQIIQKLQKVNKQEKIQKVNKQQKIQKPNKQQNIQKKPSLIVQKQQKKLQKNTSQQEPNDKANLQKESIKNSQSKKSSSKMESHNSPKFSAGTFNQNKNKKVQFEASEVQLNKTSSEYSQVQQRRPQKTITEKAKQKKISIIKHSVISKSSHRSQPTQQKIYFTGQQSHNSLINEYQIEKNQINLKKSHLKRTQKSNGKLVAKTSNQDNFESDNSNKSKQPEFKSPFKKKKSSILRPSVLGKKENYFQKYRNEDLNQSDDGYQKVFRSKNKSKIKINNSVISSDSQPDYKKDPQKIINNRDHHQYYNQNLSNQYLNQNQLKHSQSSSNNNFNSKADRLVPKKGMQASNQYNLNQTSPKIIKFNSKISQISRQTSKFQQKDKQSGVKVFSKAQDRQFDKMYNKQGNIFPSDNKNSSILQNQSYVEQYNIKAGTKFGLKYSSKQNFYQGQAKLKKKKIFTNSKQTKEYDLIKEPDDFPLLNSYYSQRQFQKQYSKVDQYSDFRSCYANFEKQILPINQSQSKVVSKSFSMDKISNFIEYKQRPSKMSTMVDAISQKNAKNSILMYKLQRQKTRLIQNLQNKIKSLQNNGKFMRTKLAVKDQLKAGQQSICTKQLSQRQNYKISNSKGIKSENENESSSNISISRDIRQKNRLNLYSKRDLQPNQIQSSVNNLKCQLLNFNDYSNFFKQISNKKSFLKKKGVLLKNEQIEIGFMVNKKQKIVNFLLFLTPLKDRLNSLNLAFQNDHNLSISLSPAKLDFVDVKKQQIINCRVNVQNIPFKTPSLILKYFSNNQQKQIALFFQLPCSMLTFCQFQQSQCKINQGASFIRTDMFKVNRKIFKQDKISQILPDFKLVRQNKKGAKFQGKIIYNQVQFIINLIQDSSGLMSIEGIWKQQKDLKFLQFLLCTLRYILLN